MGRGYGLKQKLVKMARFNIFVPDILPADEDWYILTAQTPFFRRGKVGELLDIPQDEEVQAVSDPIGKGDLWKESKKWRACLASKVDWGCYDFWFHSVTILTRWKRERTIWFASGGWVEALEERKLEVQITFRVCQQHSEEQSLIYIDIRKGYGHPCVFQVIRDWFIIWYHGNFYECIALLFGYWRSPCLSMKLKAVIAQDFRWLGWPYFVLRSFSNLLVTTCSGHLQSALQEV